jgi:hypothetical protein
VDCTTAVGVRDGIRHVPENRAGDPGGDRRRDPGAAIGLATRPPRKVRFGEARYRRRSPIGARAVRRGDYLFVFPGARVPNRLAQETSPYLLQHADNPVDWLPWGPDALARARAEDRPILLSIGYSACHWCHVMAHESFEDADLAAVMNARFVNVKVDREERPDLDELYMRAVQAFTGGHGGWPMTVFLTPTGEPFFGGTYFPPKPSRGMPSFRQVLDHVSNLWTADRAKVGDVTGKVGSYLTSAARLPRAEGALTSDWLDRLAAALEHDFDKNDAGFGAPPKFPPHGGLAVLLAHGRRTGSARALEMATATLDAMAKGGMYDLLGGGFARYSVDAHWRIPHFEKMLYDNAQLVPIYVDAWKVTKDPSYARVARESLDWVLREMTAPEGGFRSSLDADSEGEEGRFYAWTGLQIRGVLGLLDGMRVSAMLGVTDAGTFEHGTSVLRAEVPRERLPEADRELLERALPRLLAAREQRVPPGRDDKIVTAWNALMISAFARAGAAFDDPHYRGAAARAARFLLDQLRVNGRLQRTWKDGRAHIPGFADDHAFLVNALIDLYEATFDLDWLAEANALADTTVRLFWDDADGGLFYTGTDAEVLLTRSKHLLGGAEPSANGVAALAFARLDALSGRDDLGERAETILRAYQALLDRAPRALGVEALAAAWRTGPTQQIGIVGGGAERLLDVVNAAYLPFAVVAWTPGGDLPLLPWMHGKVETVGPDGTRVPTAYLCEDRSCLAPTPDPVELALQIEQANRPRKEAGARIPLRVHAPALPADPSAWLNSAPLPLDKLRGNVVVLDFWTYCCINCMHVLPELAIFEAELVGEPIVVIGVHAAKFAAERERSNVERAVRRHQVHHPVVLDPNHTVWNEYAIRSWPTVVVLDAAGRVAWQKAGEVTHEELVPVVRGLLEEARAAGILAGQPAWRPGDNPAMPGGFRYPGKLAIWPDLLGQAHGADPFGPDGRVYVADTGNHRILEMALDRGPDGWPRVRRLRCFGGNGPGLVDGPAEMACLHSPQGLARAGEALWVADTGNHALRRIDLGTGFVSTVAGTGRLGRGLPTDAAGPRKTALRSPWDIAVSTNRDGRTEAVFIAMAGAHQVWVYLPERDELGPLFGSGNEEHVDGAPEEAALAQPSGLSLVGRYLFFADSETSSIRVFDLADHKVGTLVGRGLFDFGDVDGAPDVALLQHPLGVAAGEGQLYVADTFNNKIKTVDLRGGGTHTLAGGDPGVLCEPGGLALAGDFLLVADTNNHRIRAVHTGTGEVRDVGVGG